MGQSSIAKDWLHPNHFKEAKLFNKLETQWIFSACHLCYKRHMQIGKRAGAETLSGRSNR